MNIIFLSDGNNVRYKKDVEEYASIWRSIRTNFEDAVKTRLGLEMECGKITCIVGDKISHSGNSTSEPMRLRFSYSSEEKAGFLIHELCHRLLFNHNFHKIYTDCHFLICPILFDLYKDVLGWNLTKSQIKYEMRLSKRYYDAWLRVLSFESENLSVLYTSDLKFLRGHDDGILKKLR